MANKTWRTTPTADRPPASVNPYQDWQRQNRRPGSDAGWAPVFVSLTPEAGESPRDAAARLWALIQQSGTGSAEGRFLAIDAISLAYLQRVWSGDSAEALRRFGRFFVWRPEALAYDATAPNGDAMPFEIVHVCPATPALADASPATAAPASATDLAGFGGDALAGRSGTADILTCIIDDQISYGHERLTRTLPDGSRKARSIAVWQQMLGRLSQADPRFVTVGGLALADEIDRVLAAHDERAMYDQAVLAPLVPGVPVAASSAAAKRPRDFRGTHGTYVADLAAGYPAEDAPETRPILGVELPAQATADTSGALLDAYLVLAGMFVTLVRDLSPGGAAVAQVINLSYAINAGPKDGTGFVEAELDRLVQARDAADAPTWLVLPAGNSFRDLGHAEDRLSAGQSTTLDWRIHGDDRSPSYLELWCTGNPEGRLEIVAPDGSAGSFTLHLGRCWDWRTQDDVLIGRAYRRHFAATGRTRLLIALNASENYDASQSTVPAGAYKLTLHAPVDASLDFTMDIQRDDTPTGFPFFGRQSYFDSPEVDAVDPETTVIEKPRTGSKPIVRQGTLSALATTEGPRTLVIGGTFDRNSRAPMSYYTASGPGVGPVHRLPDLCAPSEESAYTTARLAAGTYSGGTAAFSGTSNAAPQVARRLVTVLEKLAPRWKNTPSWRPGKSDVLTELLKGGASAPVRLRRLGYGVIAYADGPGRPARRQRDGLPRLSRPFGLGQ